MDTFSSGTECGSCKLDTLPLWGAGGFIHASILCIGDPKTLSFSGHLPISLPPTTPGNQNTQLWITFKKWELGEGWIENGERGRERE